MIDGETPRYAEAIRRSHGCAASLGHPRVEPAHLLLSLMEDRELVERVLEPLGVREESVRAAALRLLGAGDASQAERPRSSDEALRAQFAAYAELIELYPEEDAALWRRAIKTTNWTAEYSRLAHWTVDAEHLLLGVIADDEQTARLLADQGADYESVRRLVRPSLG